MPRIKIKNGWNSEIFWILICIINAHDQVEAIIDSHFVTPLLLQFFLMDKLESLVKFRKFYDIITK